MKRALLSLVIGSISAAHAADDAPFMFTPLEFSGRVMDGQAQSARDLRGASFNNTRAAQAVFNQSDLRAARGRHADFRAASFRGAQLQFSSWLSSDFRSADFRDANLEGATFVHCNLHGARINAQTVLPALTPQQRAQLVVTP